MVTSPKRPRDQNQLAKMIADIARGETSDTQRTATEQRASKAGTVGGPARGAIALATAALSNRFFGRPSPLEKELSSFRLIIQIGQPKLDVEFKKRA